jgi:hypothetical protein
MHQRHAVRFGNCRDDKIRECRAAMLAALGERRLRPESERVSRLRGFEQRQAREIGGERSVLGARPRRVQDLEQNRDAHCDATRLDLLPPAGVGLPHSVPPASVRE